MYHLKITFTSVAFLVLLTYHSYLIYAVRKAPLKTSFGLTSRLRRDWIEAMVQGGQGILAVQTVRNWVMTATFLASTAILLNLGMVGVALNPERALELSQTFDVLGGPSETSWRIKLMVLIIDFFATFLNFLLAIRYYNHFNFMITTPVTSDSIMTSELITSTLNRANFHNTVGLHGYYLAIPFTLWMFGSIWFLIGSMLLVAVLYKLDRTP